VEGCQNSLDVAIEYLFDVTAIYTLAICIRNKHCALCNR
jgi:hypothetical protein